MRSIAQRQRAQKVHICGALAAIWRKKLAVFLRGVMQPTCRTREGAIVFENKALSGEVQSETKRIHSRNRQVVS